MTPSKGRWDRERDLEKIRHTYERYRREGRRRLWDPSNPGFARIMRERDAALIDLLGKALPHVSGDVLDLGSGDGRLAMIARDASLPIGSWTGVDLDAGSVADASAAYPWASFIEASGDDLPVSDDRIDVVVASMLFSSLPSTQMEAAVAAEIERVLRPAGSLIWYDLRYDNPRNRAVHGMGSERLKELFPGWRMELRSLTVIPPIARRLGPITPAIYSLLHAVPILRSHLVGALQRPSRARLG